MHRRLLDIMLTRKRKLNELLSDKSLSPSRKHQIEGAINEIDFVCMLLQQNRREPCQVWEKD
jgi:hypothetical protein